MSSATKPDRGGLSGRELALIAGVAIVTAAAAAARYAHGVSQILAFVLATLALAGLAWIVSLSTERIGHHYGPAITGTLQSTVGNLPEFFVVLFALQARDRTVAETAILGSILVNALLVLGIVLIAGSIRAPNRLMRFNAQLPNDASTLLLVASFMIVLVGVVGRSDGVAASHTEAISVVGAGAILIVYGTWLQRHLRSDSAPSSAENTAAAENTTAADNSTAAENTTAAEDTTAAADAQRVRVPITTSLALLVAAGIASAFVSDWFVHALEPTIHQVHISQAFAGLVIVAIAGNAVENVTGIFLAVRGQSDLAISVVKSSVAQLAAFLFPVLVLVSLLLSTRLTFALQPVYIAALIGTAILVWQITGDGEATPFEGAALVAMFVVLATIASFEH